MSWIAFTILGLVLGFLTGRELSVHRRTRKLKAQLHRVEGNHLRAQGDLKAARIDRDYDHQRFEQSLIDISRIE